MLDISPLLEPLLGGAKPWNRMIIDEIFYNSRIPNPSDSERFLILNGGSYDIQF